MLANTASHPSEAGTDTQPSTQRHLEMGPAGELKPHFSDERRLREGRAFIPLTNTFFWQFPHVRHCLSSQVKLTGSSEEGPVF